MPPACGRDAELIDFGMRRAHGARRQVGAAAPAISPVRCDCDGQASRRFGIPVAAPWRTRSFRLTSWRSKLFGISRIASPTIVALLIDTYDTARGARRVLSLPNNCGGRDPGQGSTNRQRRSGPSSEARAGILDAAGLERRADLVSGASTSTHFGTWSARGAWSTPIASARGSACRRMRQRSIAPTSCSSMRVALPQAFSMAKETWPGPRQVTVSSIATDALRATCSAAPTRHSQRRTRSWWALQTQSGTWLGADLQQLLCGATCQAADESADAGACDLFATNVFYRQHEW